MIDAEASHPTRIESSLRQSREHLGVPGGLVDLCVLPFNVDQDRRHARALQLADEPGHSS